MNPFRKKRKEINLTQLKVAQSLKIDKSTVSKWETNESYPRADLLAKLSKLYNCTVDELLRDKMV